jgi:magnesium-transporting ATPase (P-type)
LQFPGAEKNNFLFIKSKNITMEQNPGTSLFQLNIDANTSYSLKSAASWAKVLAVCGLIIGILFIVAGLFVQNFMSGYSFNNRYDDELGGTSMQTATTIGMVMYIVIGLIFVISSIFALNFGNRISRALRANDQYTLSSGFSAVRNYFAFWAILMIILILLMLIGVAGAAAGGGR